jgi:hypothetical protein
MSDTTEAQKPDLVEVIRAAFAATGPQALEKALTEVANRVQALETALGA